ncbi:putative D-xylulose reductase A [Exophiala mesophila]|uniref:D-xylulose reductase n=1 Tax=Exophiala mesophila TaxID=212818 RepID=A0A438NAD3_EXOME|nr:putative D-xylulose reductase A [Exophiala mesophila]
MPTETQTRENNSFVLRGIKDVLFEDRPVPKLTNPHDVLLRVDFTGICGSDVHYWQHGRIGHFVVNDPMVLGHESAGTVFEVGSAVKDLKKGDRVAMEPGVPCRRCVRCKEGNYNLCFEMAFAATPPYNGTLAKYYVLPEDFCHKLPDNVSLEEGALCEPLAVGVHITKQASVRQGDSVIVFGAGPVGLLCAAVARAFGAKKVIAVDINAERLEFAKSFAADYTFIPSKVSPQENAQKIKDEFDLPIGVDVAIDASGAAPSVQTAIHVLRSGGRYVQGGMGGDEITFPIMAACTKELTVKGSFRYGSGDYQNALDLVSSGQIDVKKLISRKVSFDDAEKAFEDVKAGKAIKVLIEGPK